MIYTELNDDLLLERNGKILAVFNAVELHIRNLHCGFPHGVKASADGECGFRKGIISIEAAEPDQSVGRCRADTVGGIILDGQNLGILAAKNANIDAGK